MSPSIRSTKSGVGSVMVTVSSMMLVTSSASSNRFSSIFLMALVLALRFLPFTMPNNSSISFLASARLSIVRLAVFTIRFMPVPSHPHVKLDKLNQNLGSEHTEHLGNDLVGHDARRIRCRKLAILDLQRVANGEAGQGSVQQVRAVLHDAARVARHDMVTRRNRDQTGAQTARGRGAGNLPRVGRELGHDHVLVAETRISCRAAPD